MTSIADQYRIITSRAGWIDRSRRGRLKFTGPDAAAFLQGLLTNDVAHLEPGSGVYAAWLTPLGRMVTDITLLHRRDHLLGLVGEGLGASLAARFDQLIFAENLTVSDASAELVEVAVTGGAAADVVAAATGADAAALAALPELAQVDVEAGFVMRAGDSPFPAFRILVDPVARDGVVDRLGAAGAVVMAGELATALRIEAGRGEWGHDLGDDVIPLEAGLLDRAISTSKGCYVGQEIVIRILHRGGGRVAKRLVTMAFDPDVTAVPDTKAAIDIDGATVGHVTSAAFSPARGCIIALGYLHRDAAEIERRVTVAGSGAVVTAFAS
ncbi:MAG: aminomethyltransferase family protein [Acidobacteria bacterium]|nr:aminomethyltransferase family protein [Acidobacteriota bacterium]